MIHGSVLKALATPADFKSHYLNGQLLGITCDDLRRMARVLGDLDGISDVALYGTRVQAIARVSSNCGPGFPSGRWHRCPARRSDRADARGPLI
jgi:hypothetical protein